MKIQRYGNEVTDLSEYRIETVPKPDGEYVRVDDLRGLIASLREVHAESVGLEYEGTVDDYLDDLEDALKDEAPDPPPEGDDWTDPQGSGWRGD